MPRLLMVRTQFTLRSRQAFRRRQLMSGTRTGFGGTENLVKGSNALNWGSWCCILLRQVRRTIPSQVVRREASVGTVAVASQRDDAQISER